MTELAGNDSLIIMERRYLLAIPIPDKAGKDLETIQDKFRVQAWPKYIGPHITLIQPFTLTDGMKEVYATLRDIATDTHGFPLHISGIGSFERRRSTIFAQIKTSTELKELHSILSARLKGYIKLHGHSNEQNYEPHVTLANRLNGTEYRKRLEKIQQIPIDYIFICRNFILFEFDKNQLRWQKVKIFPFQRPIIDIKMLTEVR